MLALKYQPRAAVIDQTTRCTQRCAFCWRQQAEDAPAARSMPIALYRLAVDAIAEVESIAHLSLCGPMGEPTLVSDLAARGLYARSRGKFSTILVNTNGVFLDHHQADELLTAFSAITVSLDAATPETYRAIHGRDDFARVEQNLETLLRVKRWLGRGAAIKIRFTETEANAGEWPTVAARWAKADGFVHRHAHTFMDVRKRRAALGDGAPAACNQPTGTVNITVDGDVTTCCVNYKQAPTFGRIGNGGSLKDVWESRAFEEWREFRLLLTCGACSGLGAHSQKVTR